MFKINLVGSRARGNNRTTSDYDYVTNGSREDVISYFTDKLKDFSIKKDGERFISFYKDRKKYDIWLLPPEFSNLYRSFRALRKIDRNHLIGLKRAIQKEGLLLSPYGVEFGGDTIDILKFLRANPELYDKYYKYLK